MKGLKELKRTQKFLVIAFSKLIATYEIYCIADLVCSEAVYQDLFIASNHFSNLK